MKALALASLLALALPARAILYVCMVDDQKVFQSAPCENPQESVGEYEVRVRKVPRAVAVPQPPAPAAVVAAPPAPAAPREDCDALVKAEPGTWSRQGEEANRQRCLDRRSGATPAVRSTCVTTGAITNCVSR